MDSSQDASFWEAAGVKSLSNLQDFPFENHSDLVNAVKKGEASIGIEYAAARDLAAVTKSPRGYYIILALSWVPFLFAPASIAVAIMTARWSVLVGIVLALLGQFLASPHNPIHVIAYIGSLIALSYCLFMGTILSPGTWSAFAFGISFLVTRFLNRTAWKWARNAVLSSEAFAAYLYKTANLHIKSNQFGLRSMALTAVKGANDDDST